MRQSEEELTSGRGGVTGGRMSGMVARRVAGQSTETGRGGVTGGRMSGMVARRGAGQSTETGRGVPKPIGYVYIPLKHNCIYW